LKTAVAKRLALSELENAKYSKSEGEFEPNYATLENGERVSRVNAWGNCVRSYQSENLSSISIDDFTATIDVLAFDDARKMLEKIRKGDSVSVVGKPRKGKNGIFIALEGIQKLSFKEEMLKRLEVLQSVRERKKGKKKKETAEESGEIDGFTRASELTVEKKVIE